MKLLWVLASQYRGKLGHLPATRGARVVTNPFPTRPSLMDQSRSYWSAQEPGCQDKQERQSSPPSPPQWKFPAWIRWAFGSVLTLIIPFWDTQWRTIKRIEYEVEVAGMVVEEAADVVEKVAVMAEKASAEAAEKLPKDGKLKDAVMLVERVSKEAAAEAHLAKDIIHKVDELKEEVETLLNPTKVPERLVDKIKPKFYRK